jgi:hypothetical protein
MTTRKSAETGSTKAAADRYRDFEFCYDSDSREMRIEYNRRDTGGTHRVFAIKPWTGRARFYVNEARAAGYSKWLIAIDVCGTPPGELEIKYRLADFDFLPRPD